MPDVVLNLNLHLMLPELIVVGSGLGVILAEVLLPRDQRSRATGLLAAFGLLVALVVLIVGRPTFDDPAQGTAALQFLSTDGQVLSQWTVDTFSLFVRGLVLCGALLTVLMSLGYTQRMDRGHGEFYGILLFAVVGVLLVSGVSDLLTLFVCLELVTISAYILAAFKRNDPAATEAGMKYLVIGAVSSAALLLGVALVYGAVGDVTFWQIADYAGLEAPAPLLIAGLVLVVAGLFFKIGAVPFHVWIPDVYQGAPSPVTAFLSTSSKAAGLILMLRFGQAMLLPAKTTPLGHLWVWVFGSIAVLTLLFGIFSAIPQRSIKRLFAYSSIGHAGYLLMGFAAIASDNMATNPTTSVDGATAILYYLMAFFFTNLTAFTVIVLVSRATGGQHEAASYRGLWKRAPFLAFAMTLALLSLAGVPPLSGFFGKFLILSSVMSKQLFALGVIGALGVAVSFYFYLLWIRELFVTPPEPLLEDSTVEVDPYARVVLAVGIAAILLMGVWMGPFYRLAETAAQALTAL